MGEATSGIKTGAEGSRTTGVRLAVRILIVFIGLLPVSPVLLHPRHLAATPADRDTRARSAGWLNGNSSLDTDSSVCAPAGPGVSSPVKADRAATGGSGRPRPGDAPWPDSARREGDPGVAPHARQPAKAHPRDRHHSWRDRMPYP
jgi:hypothetical protein